MMRRLIKRPRRESSEFDVSAIRCFILLAAFFACGGILGSAAGGYVSGEVSDTLSGVIQNYLSSSSIEMPQAEAFFKVALSSFLFPAIALFLGTSAIGFLLIPPLIAARGFSLGFSAACVIRAFGTDGKLLIFAAYGINAIITTPCLFLISIYAIQISGNIFSSGIIGIKNTGRFGKAFLIKLIVFCLIILIAVVLDTYLTPQLVKSAASFVV